MNIRGRSFWNWISDKTSTILPELELSENKISELEREFLEVECIQCSYSYSDHLANEQCPLLGSEKLYFTYARRMTGGGAQSNETP
jgi:hypothetical protein